MQKKQYLECAKIINTHGIRGAVKLESYCDSPEDLSSLERVFLMEGNAYREIKVKKASVFKQFVIMELAGYNDIDQVIPLKNKILYASRDDFRLDSGDFFIADIIGLKVIDNLTGTVYGELVRVDNLGASDIYTVKTEKGEALIPAVAEFIKKVDVEKGIFIEPIEGMFD